MLRYSIFLAASSLCFGSELITPTGVQIPGGSILPYSLEEGVKVFHLKAEHVKKEIFNIDKNDLNTAVQAFNQSLGINNQLAFRSQIVKGYGYNGDIPGPAIIVQEGDRVKIIVENDLPVPTSLHFVGLITPYHDRSDNNTPILPGTQGIYEFQILQPQGTYLYESDYQPMIQLGMGLSGLFIVLPKEGKIASHDFGFNMQEWDLSENGTVRPLSTNCTWFTMNGYTAPNIPILKVHEGDEVCLRFANTSGSSDSPITLHGFAFKIIGTEGGPKTQSDPVAIVIVSPGTTRTVSFQANQKGLWRLYCSIYQKTVNNLGAYVNEQNINAIPVGGMFTYVEVTEKPPLADPD